MFSNKKDDAIRQVETVIGAKTVFKGALSSQGSVRVDGILEGEFDIVGDAVIGDAAKVTANIKAHALTIAGEVHGNVDVVDKLEILPTGRLYGDIKAEKLSISEGATFKGSCGMHTEKAHSGASVKNSK